jgi:hypothetical protein
MAAVTGQLERTPVEIAKDEGKAAPGAQAGGKFAGFGAGATEPPSMEQKHSYLTRMIFGRRLIEDALSKSSITVQEQDGDYYYVIDPPLRADVIPWSPGPAKPQPSTDPDLPPAGLMPRLMLWGEAGKMGCPTWDLPAGAPIVGGACPGAASAQTVIAKSDREKRSLLVDGSLPVSPPGLKSNIKVDIKNTICGSCYAYTGQYGQPNVQAKELLNYWWTKSVVSEGNDEVFVDVMVRSLITRSYPKTPYTFNGGPLLPVRIHSSGDFYSAPYLRAWVNVANTLWDLDEGKFRNIRFWAPTRMWVLKEWPEIFKTELRRLKGDNLVVRASAYHFDDPAPGALTGSAKSPWGMKGRAQGSCSVYESSDLRKSEGSDPRYDYSCPIYDSDTVAGEATCGAAKNPDKPGERGCRACWMHPEWRINYQGHF